MAASPIGTHPDDMGEGVSETKNYMNEIIYEEKETKCPDVTSPDDKEKGVSEEKVTGMKEIMMKKRQNDLMSLLLMIWRKV